MTSHVMAKFGKYIKEARLKKGYTLTQLAALIGLDSANLSKIENDKRSFDQKRLSLLSSALEVEEKILQEEFVSDIIAKEIIKYNCSINVLLKVEEKVTIYHKTKQLS